MKTWFSRLIDAVSNFRKVTTVHSNEIAYLKQEVEKLKQPNDIVSGP